MLNQGLKRLQPVLGDDAATDTRVLLAYALDVDRGLLAARSDDLVSAEQSAIFQDAIECRYRRQPVAQIIGVREFWGRNFIVTPDVLNPRPDTETLIEEVLKAGPAISLLDLGTGSGCILLTLLAEWPQAKGLGVDMSPKAIDIAQKNADALGLTARASLKQSNWFSNVTGQFDLIVSNPPYITADAMQTVAPEVRDWEPRMALTPEGDGLEAYRMIAQNAADYLLANGRMFLEIGYDQAKSALQIFSDNGYSDGFCIQDMAGKDRVICVKKA
ncbi:MAG: peptide chain release factor N(5)-glutamine methyltransferase [Amylibacter sp.]|nr:peptide chain release factor N(5)-glutamine methyltransferase [Amylibacter sp.]